MTKSEQGLSSGVDPQQAQQDWPDGALFGGASFPIAEGQAANNETVDISLWMHLFVPDALHRRISRCCHSVDRVVFTGNLDDHCASTLTAKLAVRLGASSSKQIGKSREGVETKGCRGHPQTEKQNCLDEKFHPYAPLLGARLRPASFKSIKRRNLLGTCLTDERDLRRGCAQALRALRELVQLDALEAELTAPQLEPEVAESIHRKAGAQLSLPLIAQGAQSAARGRKASSCQDRRAIPFVGKLDFTIASEQALLAGAKADSQMSCDDSPLERWWSSMNNGRTCLSGSRERYG
jgi:hypothetical protein